MTSSGFSFNFLPTEDTAGTAAHNEQPQRHGDEQGMTDETTDDGQNTKIRLPFAWIADADFRPLLNERASEELIYADVVVSGLDDASTAATSTTKTSTLRCVDLSISSFQRPSESSANPSNNEQVIWNRTDIEPGLYEGGRKVWECSVDLVRYLIQEGITMWHPYGNPSPSEMEQAESNIKGSTVNDNGEPRPKYALELGCGHGLPGCHLLRTALSQHHATKSTLSSEKDDKEMDDQQNAAKHHFSLVLTDYNEAVVLDATLSNIVLNCMDIHGTTTATAGSDTTGITSTNNNADVAMSDGVTCTTSTPATTAMTATTSSTGPSSSIGSILDEIEAHVVLGAGDWMDMSRQLLMPVPSSASTTTTETKYAGTTTVPHDAGLKLPLDGKFDLILAAETLYTCEAARETALLLQRHLQPVTGVAYVATKRYYFGVNGGVNAFVSYAASSSATDSAAGTTRRDSVDNQDTTEYELKIVTVKVIDNGVGNIREVLRVQCIPSS